MSDYDRIAKAISFIVSQVDNQPTLDEIAAHVHLSSFHFQRLFSRWAGITPKKLLQVLTVEHAKKLLNKSISLIDTSYSLGLSSGSRLYDHFVHLEGVTPGEYKTGGRGLTIEYAVHDTPFGEAFIAVTPRGICSFAFLEHTEIKEQIADVVKKWPSASVNENRDRTSTIVTTMFDVPLKLDRPLSLHVSGTNFQISVWKALLRIPPAMVASYAQIAAAIDRPGSARAVGQAIGANPIAFMIPCHRVIQQSGDLGGYQWGKTRKRAIHAWEAAKYEQLEL